jgi:hypothetical protein
VRASRDGGIEKMRMVGWFVVYPFERSSTDVGTERIGIVGWLTIDGFERSSRVGDRVLFGCFEIGGRPLWDRDTELSN